MIFCWIVKRISQLGDHSIVLGQFKTPRCCRNLVLKSVMVVTPFPLNHDDGPLVFVLRRREKQWRGEGQGWRWRKVEGERVVTCLWELLCSSSMASHEGGNGYHRVMGNCYWKGLWAQIGKWKPWDVRSLGFYE